MDIHLWILWRIQHNLQNVFSDEAGAVGKPWHGNMWMWRVGWCQSDSG